MKKKNERREILSRISFTFAILHDHIDTIASASKYRDYPSLQCV